LKNGRFHQRFFIISSDEINVILAGFGSADVFIKAADLGDVSGREPSMKLF